MKRHGGDRSLSGLGRRLLLASLTIAAAFVVAPLPVAAAASLSVAPEGGAVGDQLTATGAGFPTGTVSLHVDSVPGVQVAAGIVVDGGGFTAPFRIPNLAPGPHTLIACLDNRGSRCADRATASFRVVTPPATTSTTTAVATTTTTTTITATPVPDAPTTTTQPSAQVATTTSPPPPIAAPVAPSTTVASNVAMATTLPPTLAAGQALSSGEEVVLTELSPDPQDWSDDVADYLESEGIDVDELSGAVAQDTPGALLSNEGCAVQCITSGIAYAVGTGAHLRVETSVPATIYITVLDQPEGLVSSPSSTTSWGSTWAPLIANQTYTAVVYAVDANDNTAVASGKFTTLTRFANVELSNFQGQTELPYEHFHLDTWINGGHVAELHAGEDLPDPLVWSADIGDVVASLDVVIRGTMHDHQAPGSCLVQAAGSGVPTGPGDANCSYITGVVNRVYVLDTYPANATYWTEHTISTTLNTPGPFLFGDGEEAPFPFSVEVQVDVWYAYPSLQEPPGP